MADPKKVLEFAKHHDAKILDLRFTDIPGLWHHVSYPIGQLTESSFEEGFGIDGSSIRGWAGIHESDMLLKPDANFHLLDPFTEVPTLVLVCDVVDPVTKQRYDRDPRYIARKAELYLTSTGIADTAYFGAEAEFFIFDNVRFDQREQYGFYFIDAEEGRWNSGREENNLGYRPRYRGRLFSRAAHRPLSGPAHRDGADHAELRHRRRVPPSRSSFRRPDRNRSEVRLAGALRRQDAALQIHREERGQPPGQDGHVHAQADLRRQRQAACTRTSRCGRQAQPLFAGDGYAGLSQLALWYVGGLIKHGPALSAIIAPTTNSYKRLVPGFEAPVNLAYSRRNRSAACRIPMYSIAPKAKRVEFRPPDPSCNPYMAFAAMLMAGLDGIENKMDPGQPLDKDIYELDPEQLSNIPSMPGSLEDALDALERDHAFLLKGDVFTEELLRTYVDYKRTKEVDAIRQRPHPYEFALYYDI